VAVIDLNKREATGTIKHYEVQRSINSPSNFSTYMTVSGTSFLYSSHPPGATYYWRLRACNDTACSSWTSSVGGFVNIGGSNPASVPEGDEP
jgi:hypothetical protein